MGGLLALLVGGLFFFLRGEIPDFRKQGRFHPSVTPPPPCTAMPWPVLESHVKIGLMGIMGREPERHTENNLEHKYMADNKIGLASTSECH